MLLLIQAIVLIAQLVYLYKQIELIIAFRKGNPEKHVLYKWMNGT